MFLQYVPVTGNITKTFCKLNFSNLFPLWRLVQVVVVVVVKEDGLLSLAQLACTPFFFLLLLLFFRGGGLSVGV